MKMTLNVSQFRDEFKRMGRADQFSYDALGLIFDYFEDIEPDYDLDVIGICCEFAEETAQNLIKFYSLNVENDGNQLNNVLDYMHDATSVVGTTSTGTIVYRQF